MDLQTTQPFSSDSAASRAFRLEIVLEPYKGPTRDLTLYVERELSIGRDLAAALRIDGRLVSRKHVIVRASNPGLEIEDVSCHGTLVDGAYLRMGRRCVADECILVVGCTRLWLRRVAISDKPSTDSACMRAARRS